MSPLLASSCRQCGRVDENEKKRGKKGRKKIFTARQREAFNEASRRTAASNWDQPVRPCETQPFSSPLYPARVPLSQHPILRSKFNDRYLLSNACRSLTRASCRGKSAAPVSISKRTSRRIGGSFQTQYAKHSAMDDLKSKQFVALVSKVVD